MEKIALKHDLDEELAIARQKIESLQNRVVQMESEHDHAKAIASALRQSEERYKYFFENSPMGIYRTTPDGRILLCNPQLIKMLGYDSLEELRTRNLEAEGFDPQSPRSRFKELVEMQGEVKASEAAWRRKNGSIIYIRENARAVKDEDGDIICYEGTVEDITERKQLEKTKEDFISSAAHELRTPLTALQGYLTLLEKEHHGVLGKEQTYVEKLVRAAKKLHDVVEDLLSVIKLEHRPKMEFLPFEISPIIDEVVNEWRIKAKNDNKTLFVEMHEDYLLSGNPDHTKKIISNLVGNALKYTESGAVIKISCKKSITESGPIATICVQDNGVGIAKDYHQSIFEKFFRVPNALSIKAGGTGLGLYIVKQLVEMQKGRIWVDSELGIGSRFCFTLQLLEESKQLPLI
ncbi:MAG: hypothetical protein A3C85_03515 [Candidatus Doudnabacteria bacterium RIFCSPHIGHO2_02_FULL_48_21]|uniref:histidine kinase n=1 Tax=Candidatus Doudnabacteria bacterium RIFCSPLOWO2_02_FULL_48_13 TaxID=1817845 RepID=A0A1F5QAN7_9BACT|nr:MAG: hypothetical protein A3K05_03605 [Candidatus Doudnabacteria bacterium RIFCSPHIGHO2_01_48_18]OGE78767.1 MAG: hypothetical protein A2668_00020 [Candidatus Doudnabacteria bacterium RIFCSPHIGHO2_01_FULL_48_180]OGE91310.1 MAG: hypothetical protein A3F44_03300 [Candidatus Doudnabacteria bacterium RIFCSPHIGHO2_12_FULL_47_25]OGE93308.1 MAG: hypothetical protein A3C85_03515 [Candidatus Doudnabacteria bacterium RIFCSPHIGHO2_02_FULL_48_21]OGE96640.1 MAG: hypothetical protein A3A83_01570 [Candidatu